MKAGLMNLMLHGFIIEKFLQLIKKTTFIRIHCSRFVKKLSKLGQMSYFTSFENQTLGLLGVIFIRRICQTVTKNFYLKV